MKKNIYNLIVLTCFIIAWIAYGIIQQRKFENDYKVTNGIITDLTVGRTKVSPGDFTLLYRYEINGKIFTDGTSLNLCPDLTISKVKDLFIYKTFPVLYSRKNPSWNRIMIKKAMSLNLNYAYPDSLLKFDSILTCK